jgi:hypothetical protein
MSGTTKHCFHLDSKNWAPEPKPNSTAQGIVTTSTRQKGRTYYYYHHYYYHYYSCCYYDFNNYIYILLSRILHQGDSQCVGPQQCSSPCHPVFPRRAAVQCGCTTLLCAAAHPESQRGLRWEIPYEIPQRVTGNWSWASSFQQGFSECEKTWNHQAGICENICSPKYTLASCFCCDVDWFTEISHPSGDHPGIHLQNPQNS